jgi:hypothetical protein
MIDDMLQQNWSTLHSNSIDLKFRHSTKRLGASQLKVKAPNTLDRPPEDLPQCHCMLAGKFSVLEPRF